MAHLGWQENPLTFQPLLWTFLNQTPRRHILYSPDDPWGRCVANELVHGEQYNTHKPLRSDTIGMVITGGVIDKWNVVLVNFDRT
jgi:hypothetical protein